MQKDLAITELFDIYGELLTERQRELFTSYYIYDLSLSEIAQPEGKTRQNVYEQVNKVKAKLKIKYETDEKDNDIEKTVEFVVYKNKVIDSDLLSVISKDISKD